ncbi:LysR family transcriptional regulator [Yoonia sp. GPGPB17]|uniref:LysR family transcriptional regulator n=1 Tax=Yoonia sp. GPGPB17 TaxID=3026147 RepID=UPI0030BC8DF2
MKTSHNQFSAFAHVVREGSFSRAADRLGVSQSAVTQHVAKLEQTVGMKLLQRGSDGLSLTRAGRELYDLADRQVTLDGLIKEKLEGYAALERGHLAVIANAPRPALPLIAAFQKTYPNIEVDFALYDWTQAMALLRGRQVDVAVVTEPDRMGDCVSRSVTTARYVAYVPDNHRFAQQQCISLRDLAEETVLIPEEGSYTARFVARKLKDHAITFPRRMRTTTFPVMKEAILHGVGVGIFLADSGFPDDGLTGVPILELPEFFETKIVVPKDKWGLRVVAGFAELADQRMA